MRFAQAMRNILSARDYTQQQLADEVGVSRISVATLLKRDNPSMDVATKYLRPLGYRVVLVPVGAKLTQDSYVLEGSDPA